MKRWLTLARLVLGFPFILMLGAVFGALHQVLDSTVSVWDRLKYEWHR